MDPFANFTKKKFHFENYYPEDAPVFGKVRLIQIGDLSCDSGYIVTEHPQVCFEITYIYSGKGMFAIDGEEYPVKAGDIFLSKLGSKHYGMADEKEPYRFFYLGLEIAEEGEMMDIIEKMNQISFPRCEDNFDMETCFVRLFNELIHLKNFSNMMISNYLEEIIISTYRSFYNNMFSIFKPNKFKNNIQKVVYEVINYIDTNILTLKELASIADDFDYSYNYLCHIFKQEMGTSIGDYYNKKRFDVAVSWLTTTDMSVTDIADKLNYQTIHAFSRAFKKRFGMSPSQYKAIHS